MNRFRLFYFVLAIVMLAACSQQEVVPSGQASFVQDQDLDTARVLGNDLGDVTLLPQLSVGDLKLEPSLTRSQAKGSPSSALNSSQSFSNTGGYLAYVESGKTYRVIVEGVNNTGSSGSSGTRVVYSGSRPVQSVAVSEAGDFVAFLAESKAGDYDLYLVDLKGDRFGKPNTVAVVDTDDDERDISMSMDGNTLAWQGGTPAAPTIVYVVLEGGDIVDGVETTLGVTPTEPSLSGDGSTVVFLDVSGLIAPGKVILTFNFETGAADAWYASSLSNPSLDYTASLILFEELFSGVNYLSLLDTDALSLTDILAGPDVDHPYLAADGEYLTFAFGGVPYLGTVAGEFEAQKIKKGASASATYWAKGSFRRYSGSITEDDPTFVRPDQGAGLSDAERTVHYDARAFKAPKTDYYEILSIQDYDGYLNLYEGSFDPNNPEENLLASNDDYNGGFDADIPLGRSRIVAQLQKNTTYIVVTSACGDPNAGCGPDLGNYTNTISDGASPPAPPYVLPDPDPTGFNITIRFVDDNLTPEQAAVFIDAAARWSAIITEDIADVPGFSLPENYSYEDTGEVVGTLDDVLIDVAIPNIDGPSGVLGRAGPRLIRPEGSEDEYLTVYGIMEFDVSEFAPGGFFDDEQQYRDVIVHEMGHVIGIGTLWQITDNTEGVLSNPPTVSAGAPNPDYDPRFTGAGAVAEYQILLDDAGKPLENTVPIANTGGSGNYNGHWRELVFENELMTPYAGGTELLSRMTAASLGDLGYTVDPDSSAVDQNYALPPAAEFEQISPNPETYEEGVDFLRFSGAAGEVTGLVQGVDLNLGSTVSTSGCEAADFAGFTAGNIALLRRGECAFVVKVDNAVAAGASGVIMFNQGDSDDPSRTGLFKPSTGDNAIPAVAVGYALGQELANTPGLTVRISTPVAGTLSTASVLGTAAQKPAFDEEVLQPIGTVAPGGKITLFGKE